jgi:hypothetical protein
MQFWSDFDCGNILDIVLSSSYNICNIFLLYMVMSFVKYRDEGPVCVMVCMDCRAMWLDITVRVSLRGCYVCSQLRLTAYSAVVGSEIE